MDNEPNRDQSQSLTCYYYKYYNSPVVHLLISSVKC